jgi:hypothetical protein
MLKRAFIASRNHPQLGLETFAILYSLPYALLLWGCVHDLYAPNSYQLTSITIIQYDFILRSILFDVLPSFQHGRSKFHYLTLCSRCHPCWLVRLNFLGKARGRASDPTLC